MRYRFQGGAKGRGSMTPVSGTGAGCGSGAAISSVLIRRQLPSAARGARSRRSYFMRVRIVAKSSAARGRGHVSFVS